MPKGRGFRRGPFHRGNLNEFVALWGDSGEAAMASPGEKLSASEERAAD